MNIDANLIFSENQAISAASVNSNAVKVGKGVAYHSLFVNVDLTTPMTSGAINTIKVQTATDEAFTSPRDLMTIHIASGVDQTVNQNLAMFRLPFNHDDYVRLVYGATSPVGGKVFASLVKDVPVR